MVRAKKHLGQHFLTSLATAQAIVGLLSENEETVLEIGPGEGVLTDFLVERVGMNLHMVEIDTESVAHLREQYPASLDRIHETDFLKMDLRPLGEKLSIIGNFPYNISSQILFRVFEERDRVTEVVGMFQKEVAKRVASGPGNKTYGILSVLLQAYYTIDYHITVPPEAFRPPPKVESGVIRLVRNKREGLPMDDKRFKSIVKTAFGQRRKTLRNSLKGLIGDNELPEEFSSKRPEQLGVDEFIRLAQWIVSLD